MKKNLFKFSFILVLAWLIFCGGQAKADTATTTIRLQIITNDASLYDSDIEVGPCADSQSATTTSVNAKCAIEQSGLTSDWSWWGDDAFLNDIGGYVNNNGGNGVYWAWFGDLVYGEVALNKHLLSAGEKLLLTYDTNPLKISTDNTSPYVNATSTITLEQFGLDVSWNPVWSLAASSTLAINGAETENDSGAYIYTPVVAGEKIIYGKKLGYVNSDSITIMAREVATSSIRLQIKTSDASLYDQDITVAACPEADGSATSTVNARCAVDQTGLTDPSDWIYGGTFLNSIKGIYASDYVNNVYIYWGWFSNLKYGDVSMTQHILTNGEKLLLTYNTNPLRIATDNTALYVNATSTITVEQFGLDSSWNPVWSLAASSTLVIAGLEVKNDSGAYEYTATTTAPVLIYGKKSGYVDSEKIIITAQEVLADDNNNQSSGGSVILPAATGGGGGSAVVSSPKVDLGKAIDFLISKQSADGSFGSALQTDWAATALASANANGAAAQKTKSYLLSDPNPLAGLNPVSDYARRAMALMSLNINPYAGVKTDYVKKIIDLYDGRQFGDASLYNDDIFALMVLNKAGYAVNDEIIQNTVNFIISKQQAGGSWNGSDLTAAAIQALTPLSSLDGVSAAMSKARNFLFNAQSADGGFGNTYATAWVMQAISALGENPSDWQKNNNTPESYLALSQSEDGGLEKDNAYEANRLWSTAYAIPAVQNKPWFNIMNSFVKEENQPAAAADSNASDNSVATSILEKLDIASSSPEALITASSTKSSLQKKVIEEKVKPKAIKTANAPSEPVKQATPRVLAAELIPPEPGNEINKKVEKKPNQEMVQQETMPTVINNTIKAPVQDNDGLTEPTVKEKTNTAAKIVLYFAGGATIILGFYLILKLLRNLL